MEGPFLVPLDETSQTGLALSSKRSKTARILLTVRSTWNPESVLLNLLDKAVRRTQRTMGKRPADPSENEGVPLKAGDREENTQNGDEVGDFEDEFEDEYESEDEIFEAGVDGRPDEEREAEERRGTWITPAFEDAMQQ